VDVQWASSIGNRQSAIVNHPEVWMISGLPWGLALSSGVNTYLPLFLLAIFARFGHVIHLSPRFSWLVSDQAIFILGALALCEILAQKFPVLDNVWDFLHTLLRPIAGAVAAGATLNTSSAFEIVVAMLMGGTLAAAAHSTKSSLRLMSTSKSYGTANFAISLGEDAGVLTTTLLSLYAPWVMLAIVIIFAVAFAFFGPRILRTLAFDVNIAGSAVKGIFRWVFQRKYPTNLKESLLEIAPERLAAFTVLLERNEELLGALPGWKRAQSGPRRAWVLFTSRRLLWIESRLFRNSRAQSLDYEEIALARHRNMVLYSRAEFLTHRHENFTLTMASAHIKFGEMAVQMTSQLAGLNFPAPPPNPQAAPRLAALPR
jgi:hypothetical protein